MPISYVGGQIGSITASTATNTTINFSLTGGLASTPAAGDFVVAGYSIASTTTRVPTVITADYTASTSQSQNDTFDANLRIFWKRMTSTPDTSIVFGPTGATVDGGFFTIDVFRDVDVTTPIQLFNTQPVQFSGLFNSGSVDPFSVTPVASDHVLLIIGANAHGTSGTFSAAYFQRFQTGQNIAHTNRTTMGSGFITGLTPNVSYNPPTWNWSANANTQSYNEGKIFLRPTPSAATGRPKFWSGTAWVQKPLKVWNGTAWVEKPVKYWNGTAWVTVT